MKNNIICDVFPPFLSIQKINILNIIKKTNSSKSIYNNIGFNGLQISKKRI